MGLKENCIYIHVLQTHLYNVAFFIFTKSFHNRALSLAMKNIMYCLTLFSKYDV